MKTACSILLIVLMAAACDKPIMSDTTFVDLNIVRTNTPKTAIVNQDIIAHITVSAPDLCYKFAYFTVAKQQFLVDVHAKGTYPTHPGGCPMALYSKDTTLSVPTATAGTYVLRFYNGNQLFKSDPVQVN